MKGLENLESFQYQKLWKMEKIDLGSSESGILKLTGRAGMTSLQGVFGVDVVDGEDKSKK